MRIAIAEGVSLHVRRWGEASQPQALLIHGFGDTSFVWQDVVRRIEPRIPAIALDLRGHGDSSWHLESDYRIGSHATDVAGLIEHLALSDLMLVGHSLGAAVTILVARAMPERVHSVVLVDGGPQMNAEALDYIYEKFRMQPLLYRRIVDFADALASRSPLAERSTIDAYAREILKPHRSGGFVLKSDPALRLTCQHPSEELWPALQSLCCPVLIARGRASAVLTPEAASRMLQNLPTRQLVSIPAAGHSILLENPAALASEILSFLVTHSRRPNLEFRSAQR